jgi:transcriptional regulator with XRE-family HTH domain
MSDRESFGPRLRAERERRGISIDTIASVTKVGGDLWDGLERNDFSRWPSGIFARAFVRDYARAIGLDSDEVVNEFCRLFPIGDRRASRLIQAQAELIGHDLAYAEAGALKDGDRRAVPYENLTRPWPSGFASFNACSPRRSTWRARSAGRRDLLPDGHQLLAIAGVIP